MIGSNGLLEWVAAWVAPHAILWTFAVDIFSGLTVECSDHGHSFFAKGGRERVLEGRGSGDGKYYEQSMFWLMFLLQLEFRYCFQRSSCISNSQVGTCILIFSVSFLMSR